MILFSKVLFFLQSYWRTLLWLVLIIFLSTFPVEKVQEAPMFNIPHFDKIVHFFMYYIFAHFWLLDLYKTQQKTSLKLIVIMALSSIFLGGLMEIIQANFTANRQGDFIDALTNSFGVLIALLIFLNLEFYRNFLLKTLAKKRK